MDKKKILSVELKITSVLLGEKNDDAYISEIDFAELIPKAKILGSAEDSDKSPPKNAPAKTEEKQKEDSWTKDSEW